MGRRVGTGHRRRRRYERAKARGQRLKNAVPAGAKNQLPGAKAVHHREYDWDGAHDLSGENALNWAPLED